MLSNLCPRSGQDQERSSMKKPWGPKDFPPWYEQAGPKGIQSPSLNFNSPVWLSSRLYEAQAHFPAMNPILLSRLVGHQLSSRLTTVEVLRHLPAPDQRGGRQWPHTLLSTVAGTFSTQCKCALLNPQLINRHQAGQGFNLQEQAASGKRHVQLRLGARCPSS